MAVEVTVRFAGTLIDVVVVEPGGTYRLGSAPGVDLAIPGLLSFPLVDSAGLIRIPAGITAIRDDDARLADVAPVALAGDTRIDLSIGHVRIALAVAKRVAPLHRARVDRRPWPYLGLALVAHLAVWATAMTHGEGPAPLPRLVHARLAKKPPPPPPPPIPNRGSNAMEPDAGRMGKKDTGRAEGQYAMHAGGMLGSISGAQLHRLMGSVDLGAALAAATGPVAPSIDETGFGGAARFDPASRPGFESIKTGRYATVAHGRGAGDDYHLAGETTVEVELCATKACVATGAIDRARVHSWIAPHASDFRACFDGTPSVVVDFTIANGIVRGARGRGATGACAAAIVSGIAFPRTDGTTRVRYEVTYQRS